MFLMFAAGLVVIISGFAFDHNDFVAAIAQRDGGVVELPEAVPLDPLKLMTASVMLFDALCQLHRV
jgi:hypothetical protein